MSRGPGNAGATNVRFLVIVVGSLAILVGLAAACLGDTALAQGLHGGHSGHASSGQLELMTGIDHGFTLAATALLAGLAPFATLVWLPASREVGNGRDAIRPFGLLAWILFYVLTVAGVGELSAYAMRASGEPLSNDLFKEALLDTRVGAVWLARLGFGVLTTLAITAAVRLGWAWLWWAAAGTGSLLLMTLTQLSHAAAEGRFLPFLADWVHAMAAALWMGGLLGFVVALFSGLLGALAADRQAMLRELSVRRFSKVATTAVLVLASTGLYAILLHVPSLKALVATPYGRALLVKLGLLMFVLAIGAVNFLLRGRGPFGHLVVVELLLALGLFIATGFLTSLPPASAA
jgi:copper transport protein